MDLALNPTTGDLDLAEGDLFLVEGLDATAQALQQNLRLFRGEWFLDENSGVPYHDEIYVKNPKGVVIDTIFKTAILDSPGVIELMEYGATLNGRTRRLRLDFKARSQGGIINFSATQPGLTPGVITLEDGQPMQTENGDYLEIEY